MDCIQELQCTRMLQWRLSVKNDSRIELFFLTGVIGQFYQVGQEVVGQGSVPKENKNSVFNTWIVRSLKDMQVEVSTRELFRAYSF